MDELIRAVMAGSQLGFVLIESSYFQSGWPILNLLKQSVKTLQLSELKDSKGDATVILEDLTEALMLDESTATYKLLNNQKSVIGMIQTDLFTEEVIKKLEYLADTIIKVITSQGHNSPLGATVEMICRQHGGKVTRDKFTFEIVGLGLACRFTKVHPPSQALTDSSASEALPTSSFNLNMTAEQRSAKDSLVLPYMRVMQDDTKESPKVLADDFDDEDPDDDLDF